jgi:AcrR family transcriptional regulator
MAKKVLQQEREDWRRREYRRLILRAAERVIVRKGLSATTMDDVAREAEFSKATLYQYFSGKTGLLLEILANFFEETAQGIEEISRGPGSAREKLRESIRFYLEYNQEKENVARMLWMDREFRDKMSIFVADERRLTSAADLEFLDTLKLKRKATLDSVARIIEVGVASGEFRKVDVPDAVTILESLLQGFCHLRPWQERALTVQEAADIMYEFILRGMENTAPKAKGVSL